MIAFATPLIESRRSSARLVTAGAILLCSISSVVFAQSPAPVPVPATGSPSVVPSATWASLNVTQQKALAPLSKSWDGLSEGQKRKWLAIAKNYPGLAPADQEKMHSRMVEWAAMSPKDRELARLNFAQTKAVPKADRTAEWEAYQALSPEEKQKLASSGAVKPVGAAVAPKPVSPDKLAAVPVTRHTPEEQRNAIKASQAAPAKKPDANSTTPPVDSATPPKS